MLAVILTAALVARLVEEKLLTPALVADIGLVETALAVRAGDSKPVVNDAAGLRGVFQAADEIFLPDIEASTAGAHVAKVLRQLGIADQVAERLRVYPNGATAMRQLAASRARRPIGCTQSTEIIATEVVALSWPLPEGCDLATKYTAAITARYANGIGFDRPLDQPTAQGPAHPRRLCRLAVGRLPYSSAKLGTGLTGVTGSRKFAITQE